MQKIILICVLTCSFADLKSQQIIEFGSWPNNANFTIEYHQDRLITSTTSGIPFLDVSDPTDPEPASSLGSPAQFPMAIAISGQYAYFGGGMTGYFMVANISNIDAPVQTGITMDISGTAYQIAITGDLAFMPTNSDSLYAIDISDPNSPTVIDRIGMNSFSSGIAVSGDHGFVGTLGGLKVVDISDPTNMSIITSFGGGYDRIAPDLANSRLIVSKDGQGFDVIDISDPLDPSVMFQGIGGGSNGPLAYWNGLVFQIGPGNVSAFMIDDNSSTYITSYNTTINGQVNSVAVKDSVFFVSTVNAVHVLSLSGLNVGVEGRYGEGQFGVYPNPTRDILFLEVNASGSMITIHEPTGKLIAQLDGTNGTQPSIDVSGLANGIYVLQVVTPDGSVGHQRFIRN